MEHYLQFAPTQRVTKASLPRGNPAKPYVQPITTPWSVALPPGSLPKLLMGFRAEIMDHKWHVYADGPDADGFADVHFLRSWTGNPIVTARIKTDREGGAGGEQARIVEITWEADPTRGPFRNTPTEESARNWVLDVCDWVFGIRLPGQTGDYKSLQQGDTE
ncbi:endoplasmic oxidoreductin 1 precursor [Purpureocillium lavendulum]|uniref:Endoplasmic oxidoreductin 1 n=1 Tax=Purpureocillium lavendulum TaxID=1247861 RepID=A0AB34FUT1_9HYPO|nr:endoplasmic oxidoreductin 1 precursor [Purpureocillium lavendulum]